MISPARRYSAKMRLRVTSAYCPVCAGRRETTNNVRLAHCKARPWLKLRNFSPAGGAAPLSGGSGAPPTAEIYLRAARLSSGPAVYCVSRSAQLTARYRAYFFAPELIDNVVMDFFFISLWWASRKFSNSKFRLLLIYKFGSFHFDLCKGRQWCQM